MRLSIINLNQILNVTEANQSKKNDKRQINGFKSTVLQNQQCKNDLQTLNLKQYFLISVTYFSLLIQMGNQSQSPANNQQILQKYTLAKHLSQGKNLYKHNTSKKQFISIERTFPNQQAIKQYEKNMQNLLSVKHPYFLNQTQHTMTTASMLCSVQYRVVHFFQYESHTLEYELGTRKTHERYFEQKEIWSILCSTVLAMAHLTKNDVSMYTLHPKDIAIDKAGMIKILSPLLTEHANHQVIDPSLYYSPEHLKALKTQSFSQLTNKSCVFTLGITLLHIMSLEPMNQLYNYENCTINMELLNQLIEKIAHTQIKQVIKKMVKFHGYDRITFTELQDMLYNILQGDDGQESNRFQDHQEDMNNSRLKNSIHQLNQSGLNQDQQYHSVKDSHMVSYQTGPLSSRDHYNAPKEDSSTSTRIKPLMNDISDTPNYPVHQSGIDIQKNDEQDITNNQNNLIVASNSQKSKLPQSHYTYNTTSLNNSNLYQTTDNKTLRKALHQVNSFQNITLGKSQQQKPLISVSNTRLSQPDQTKPHHVRQQLKRGIYEGYKLNNMRHGYGVFYYSDGGKYAGEWFKNKMQGRGALYYANDQIAYQGQWHNDKLHGYGVLYNELPTYVVHPFDFRTLHLVDNLWVKYEGNFFEDQKQGEGTLYLSNGQCYRGHFSKDLPNGNGVYECLNGKIIKGNWILGMMQ